MIAVDTHVLIWDALTPARLSPAAIEAIATANRTDGILISPLYTNSLARFEFP